VLKTAENCLSLQKLFIMETQPQTKVSTKPAPKPKPAQPVRQGSNMKELYGCFKGKIHCDDSVFNLGR